MSAETMLASIANLTFTLNNDNVSITAAGITVAK